MQDRTPPDGTGTAAVSGLGVEGLVPIELGQIGPAFDKTGMIGAQYLLLEKQCENRRRAASNPPGTGSDSLIF